MACLLLGDKVKPWGKIIAIGNGRALGERYYFLKKGNCISMMPASVIEKMYYQQSKEAQMRECFLCGAVLKSDENNICESCLIANSENLED